MYTTHINISKLLATPCFFSAFSTPILQIHVGMLVNKPVQGFGMRSWRYSALIDNKQIVHFNEEPGLNNLGLDSDPYEVSDPDSMLEYFNMAK